MGGAKVAVTGIVFINIDQMKLQSSGLVLVKKKLEENIDQCWIWWRWSKVSSKAATQRNLSWCNNEKRTLFANIFTFKMFWAVDRFAFFWNLIRSTKVAFWAQKYSCYNYHLYWFGHIQKYIKPLWTWAEVLTILITPLRAPSKTRGCWQLWISGLPAPEFTEPPCVSRSSRSSCSISTRATLSPTPKKAAREKFFGRFYPQMYLLRDTCFVLCAICCSWLVSESALSSTFWHFSRVTWQVCWQLRGNSKKLQSHLGMLRRPHRHLSAPSPGGGDNSALPLQARLDPMLRLPWLALGCGAWRRLERLHWSRFRPISDHQFCR